MLILIIAFVAFFGAVVLVLMTATASRSKEAKQTRARLEKIAAPQGAHAQESLSLVREQPLSGLPWLDELLRRLDFTDKLQLLLYQADLKWTVGKLILISGALACVCGYLVYFRTGAALMGLLVAGLAGVAPFLYVSRAREKRFDRMRQYLPEALDLMVSAIRAGHSFSSAMGMAAKECPEPIRREFRQAFDEQNFGLELRYSLENLAYRAPIHEIRIIVSAILIQAETGGNLAEILEKVAYLIRDEFRIQRQVRVHTAQGRMTGWILSLLPPVLGFMLYLMSPDNMSLLWTRPVGRKMLFASVVMTLIGTLLIRKIVRIKI